MIDLCLSRIYKLPDLCVDTRHIHDRTISGRMYFGKIAVSFSWLSLAPKSLLAMFASCLLMRGPDSSSSSKSASSCFNNSSSFVVVATLSLV